MSVKVKSARTYIVHKNFEMIGGVFGGMREGDFTSLHQQSPTDKTCYIYRCKDNPGVIVCQCNMDVTPEQAFSFSTQVKQSVHFICSLYNAAKQVLYTYAPVCTFIQNQLAVVKKKHFVVH